MATSDDQRLLVELFSDPDPMVREISLRPQSAHAHGVAARGLGGMCDRPGRKNRTEDRRGNQVSHHGT